MKHITKTGIEAVAEALLNVKPRETDNEAPDEERDFSRGQNSQWAWTVLTVSQAIESIDPTFKPLEFQARCLNQSK